MTLVLTPIRSDNGYFGLSKETSPGNPVAPSVFPRWMDGSKIELDLKAEDIKEGDGSRRLSQIIKNQQSVKITIVFTPRSNELGFFEAAAMGSGADTYTPPTVSTAFSIAALAGATTFTAAATTGMTPSTNIALVLGAGSASEEIVTCAVPASGNVLTVSGTYNGGNGLKYAHSTSGATSTIQNPANHVLTDQVDGNYYTIEVGLGSLNGAGGTTLRVRSCKVESLKRSAKAGGYLIYEVQLVGIASTVQNSPATITLEQHPIFLYTTGVWNIDGSTSSTDALSIESFDIEQKNNLDTGIQTESLTLAALIFGNVDVGLAFSIVWTNPNKLYQTYFGSVTGTTDAQAIGLGSFSVTFTQADGFQSVTYTINTATYTKTGTPEPKKDGKAYKQAISATSVSNQGLNTFVLQTSVNNLNYAQY